MEDNEQELGDALEKAIKSVTRQQQVVDGIIIAVDSTAFTCEVKVGDSLGTATYFDVPLRVLKNSQASVIEIPVVGTECTIYFMDGNLGRPKILMVHSVEQLLVNCQQVIFNGGALGGMVKVIDLVKRLNNIENIVNSFFTLFNGHTHNVTAVGSPTGPSIQQETTTITPTQVGDIENPVIKQ